MCSSDLWNVCGAAGIWLLLSAPALWMWFGDPTTTLRTHRISTFGNGVTLDALRLFFTNYAKQFDWSYLATTGDPIPGATWRYLAGFGAFYWWVVPLAALGLCFLPRIVPALWARRFIWLWLLVYPIGGALTNEAVPNAPRTLAGAPVFCILAAVAIAGILDALARALPRANLRGVLEPVFVAGTLASTVLFARYYFVDFVHVYPNAWNSGTRALFAVIRAEAPHYARACYSLYPSFYALHTYARYYLNGVTLPMEENPNDPICYAPGTLLVTDTTVPIVRPGFHRIALVRDVDGLPFAIVAGRT